MATTTLTVQGPYDLALSLQARASFSPEPAEDTTVLRMAVRIDGRPVLMEVRQESSMPAVLQVSCRDNASPDRLQEQAGWVVLADLDLGPFYRITVNHPILGPVAMRFQGMKPIRPATLFEMAVDAVIEQQISLIAARRIRARLVERFGERTSNLWIFPEPETLARAAIEELRACGLSGRKAEYINGLAGRVADGSFDLDALKGMSDDEVRSVIEGIRGFGRWSADYILIRGLGRPDAASAGDLAVRTIIGKYLGDGSRMTAEQVEQALMPFVPYRGIAVFYLLVYHRLAPGRT
jgi:DNA-3-methyladenine glycosylase II